MMNGQINQHAFNTFFYWCNERHSIFLKKFNDEPKPWTEDKILQNWKFCNVYRTLDRQSMHLIHDIIEPNADARPGILLFNLFAFRAFNWYETYRALGGFQTYWDPEAVNDLLAYQENSGKLTSGAYMIRGREGMPKRRSIVMTLTDIWNAKDDLVMRLSLQHSMHNAFERIMERGFWGWGEFTTYQVVLDLTYTHLLSYPGDINLWCAFGPGAKRGLQYIWPDIKNSELLERARYLLSQQGKHLKGYMPIMTLQDIEFSLCELGKYLRIEGGGRAKEKYQGA